MLADGGAFKLDVAIFVADDLVGELLGLLVHLRHHPPDEPLHREEGVFCVHHRLPLGDLPHQPISVLRVGHHRWRRPLRPLRSLRSSASHPPLPPPPSSSFLGLSPPPSRTPPLSHRHQLRASRE
ncbi:hypothetical protein FH972_016492 [Carpinus fangiana]|uniref:Uncharacterized protein n=1 Tax=Carpinus fangiana TaxID=176857 RepID=A0A5N6RJE6_9ROSI|nr:hypothetical protein FH972_016492 [Carpinus fangiana]